MTSGIESVLRVRLCAMFLALWGGIYAQLVRAFSAVPGGAEQGILPPLGKVQNKGAKCLVIGSGGSSIWHRC